MNCPNCGNEVNGDVCSFCGVALQCQAPAKVRADKLGSWAIIMAFFMPVVGLVLGILSVCFAPRRNDYQLMVDGIKAIVMSVVVAIVWILYIRVLFMLGVTMPFVIFA
ncbi:MAG: hypothetical protein J1F36_01685 [Clostridiales bacterium]|nr:hypothetical protein [Clostridiales bacterium]